MGKYAYYVDRICPAYVHPIDGVGLGVCKLVTGQTVFFYQSRAERDPKLEHLYMGEIETFIETPSQRYDRDDDLLTEGQLMRFYNDYRDRAMTLRQLKNDRCTCQAVFGPCPVHGHPGSRD